MAKEKTFKQEVEHFLEVIMKKESWVKMKRIFYSLFGII